MDEMPSLMQILWNQPLAAGASWKVARVWTGILIMTALPGWSKGQGFSVTSGNQLAIIINLHLVNSLHCTQCELSVKMSKRSHISLTMCVFSISTGKRGYFRAICLFWCTVKVAENRKCTGKADRRPLWKSRRAHGFSIWLGTMSFRNLGHAERLCCVIQLLQLSSAEMDRHDSNTSLK